MGLQNRRTPQNSACPFGIAEANPKRAPLEKHKVIAHSLSNIYHRGEEWLLGAAPAQATEAAS